MSAEKRGGEGYEKYGKKQLKKCNRIYLINTAEMFYLFKNC